MVGNHKVVIISVVALALLTPFTVKVITDKPTSTLNYAAERSTESITLIPTDQPLSIGSEVSFKVTHPQNIANPRIEVVCYQDNKLTYIESGGTGDKFVLGDPESRWFRQYPNDPAECTANLYYMEDLGGKEVFNKLTTTSFSVQGR